jgi:multimeric flavodoxin WrbA
MNIKRLIINTYSNIEAVGLDVINTDDHKIGNCIGCTHCWLKTPGICAVKDDWEMLFQKILKADTVVFIAEAKLGFVSYKLKNIVDRLLPLITPQTMLQKGETRHKPRYKKGPALGLIYIGDGDREFLNEWLGRVALNFSLKSLGVYSYEEMEEICHEFGDIQLLPKS